MALSTPTAPESLPTSSAPPWKYEVFLSFRRVDTGRGFTSYLYNELQKKEIKTFMDTDKEILEEEEGISQIIQVAIQQSRIAIIVLSENYASSSKCLDELTQIIQCMEIKETILPVFYHVIPSDVRNQRWGYGEAFAKHEQRFKGQVERLKKWRAALNKMTDISGWDIRGHRSDRQLVQEIVEFVCSAPTEIELMEDIETRRPIARTQLNSARSWKYDVFINFRGVDTRKGFLSHLYDELQNTANLTTVKDDGPLAIGRNIKLYLLRAIKESRLAIILLSENFASSVWCLMELAQISECMRNHNRILPIFYQVDPAHVRHQKGRFESYFISLESRHDIEEVRRWRQDLTMVANLSGFDSSFYQYEGELIKDVVKEVCSRLVQLTELTEGLEATEDAMNRTSPQLEPAPVQKNDAFSSLGMEDTRDRRGSVAHSDLQNTEVSKTFRNEDQFEKGTALPTTTTSPDIGQNNDKLLEYTHRDFVTHSGHEIQNTIATKTFTNDDHLEQHIAAPSVSAHSSAEQDPRLKYDVFLSFKGEDTRRGFIAYLYRELQNTRVIKTFKDDVQLEKGTVIASNLQKAIEESRFAIIVLSEKYADSAWCLDELAEIYQCMEGKDTILPIFYKLDPAVVRYQLKSFRQAFIKHEARHDIEKTNRWRAALTGVAGMHGWDSKNFPTDIELIKDIVKHLLEKVLQAPIGNFGTFEATREAMDEVMKMLKDDQVTLIGVHGVAGVGKTTMVKHVGEQAEKDELFDVVITVVISKSSDLQEIQDALYSLGLEEGIMRGDRMLIILDDIWESFELSSIGIPSHHELQRCKSKVVLTTRESFVCHSMGCHAQIPLNVLSEIDSWKLFKDTSGKTFHESTSSYDEERKVTQESRGLPKAIKAAARTFEDRYLDEWNQAVAGAFGDNCLEERNEAIQTLNLKAMETFHSLKYDSAKSWFLLCCLFPANYDIQIEELLKYGIGIGLFQYNNNNSLQEARDRVHSVITYLKASTLLLDGTKKGCIRMTDGIRDLALSKLGNGLLVKPGCELEEWPEAEAGFWQELTSWLWGRPINAHEGYSTISHLSELTSWLWGRPINAHEGYSVISLMRNKFHKLPEYLVCSKLQILLLQSNAGICDIPETFLQSPNALRVFDLSFTSILSLPRSFSFLTSLKALNLDFCRVTDISVLGNLKKLEILSMRELSLQEFPKQIGNLTSLRKLDISGRYIETIPSKVISRLYRLEELHMKYQFGKWGSLIDASEVTNAGFDELTGLLDLNILEVYISDATCLPQNVENFKPNWVEFDICISRDAPHMSLTQHDGFSRTLTLDTTINSLPDWFISVVTEKVEKLEYTNCEDLTDVVGEYDHGRIIALKYLSVDGRLHKNLKQIFSTIGRFSNKPVFENLEELHLRCLHFLERLCVGELPPGSLRKLRLLKVQTCSSLVNELLPLTLLQRLQNLETIISVNLEQLKHVFGSDEGFGAEKICLGKLREMRLSALDELVSICNGPALHAIFQNLKILAICQCKELKSLFTINVAECLFQLEDLSVQQCPILEKVIEASNSLNSEIQLPALKKLALIDLPVLTTFCTEGVSIESQCPSLEYLYVEKCIQFSYYANYHFSKKQIHSNDPQHFSSLVERWEEMHSGL